MGGGAPSSTTNTSTTQIDPTMKQWLGQNYAVAQGINGQQYNPYGGQMVAPLNGDQQNAIGAIRAGTYSGVGMPAVNQGIANATAAGAYSPQQVSTGTWNNSAAGQYMNPYTQQVINTTNAQIDRNTAQTQQNTNSAATTAGAYGGTRQAVQNSMNDYNGNMVKAQTDAQLQDQAYNNAQTQFNSDQARALTAGTANQSAGLQGANLGLGSASLLGQLGAAQNGLFFNTAGQLYNAGSAQQDIQNQQNLWNYQNGYLNPQQWPLRGLNALESAVSGIPSGSSTSATSPLYTNHMGSALGGAASGAALGGALAGASQGAIGGPMGMGIGAIAGGLLGYFGS